jgi:nucleoside-diphosphate-sugar epimerase
LLDIINEAAGRKVSAKYVKNPIKNYIYRTLADTSKTKRVLGFSAKTGVKTGVRAIIDELTAA